MNNHSCKPRDNRSNPVLGNGSNGTDGPNSKPLFHLGPIVGTLGALEALQRNEVAPLVYLSRHMAGDWGELCPEDEEANQSALESGARLMSAYTLSDGTKIWIITDAVIDEEQHRQATTLLLPEDY